MKDKIRRELVTLRCRPLKVLSKYINILIWKIKRAPRPYFGEDYNKHWNRLCFKDKVVLDLGADYGSTAYFFLRLGARKVIAVEGDKDDARRLRKYFGKDFRVVCLHKWIDSPSDYEALVLLFKPDVVKVDIEGGERFLLLVDTAIIRSVPEWLVETHSSSLHKDCTRLFNSLGFKLSTSYERDSCAVIYASLDG